MYTRLQCGMTLTIRPHSILHLVFSIFITNFLISLSLYLHFCICISVSISGRVEIGTRPWSGG